MKEKPLPKSENNSKLKYSIRETYQTQDIT